VHVAHLECQVVQAGAGRAAVRHEQVLVIAGRGAAHEDAAVGIAIGDGEGEPLHIEARSLTRVVHADRGMADLEGTGALVARGAAVEPVRMTGAVEARGLVGHVESPGRAKRQRETQVVAVEHALGVEAHRAVTAQFGRRGLEQRRVRDAPDHARRAARAAQLAAVGRRLAVAQTPVVGKAQCLVHVGDGEADAVDAEDAETILLGDGGAILRSEVFWKRKRSGGDFRVLVVLLPGRNQPLGHVTAQSKVARQRAARGLAVARDDGGDASRVDCARHPSDPLKRAGDTMSETATDLSLPMSKTRWASSPSTVPRRSTP
jgi:hypothetical protein